MIRLQIGLRRLVLRTRNWPVLSCLYRQVYRGAARLFGLALGLVLGRSLRGLYLRRGMAGVEWSPGVSDVDLLVVLENLSGEVGGGPVGPPTGMAVGGGARDEIRHLRRIWAFYGAFKRFFPFMGEIQIATGPEISAYSRWGGIRAQEMPAWKPLAGRAFQPGLSRSLSRRQLCLQEAVFSYLFLAQTYFENAKSPIAPDFGFKIAKGFLDTFRYSEAVPAGGTDKRDCESGSVRQRRTSLRLEAVPVSQSRQRECLRGRIPDALFRSLERPEILSRDEALLFMRLAMERLDGICSGLGEVPFKSPGSRPIPAPPNVRSVPCDPKNPDMELWERRLENLKRCGAPSGTGLYMDTLFRWYVVLESPPDTDAFRAVSDQMDDWHLKDNAFQAPGWLVTLGILQGIILGSHLDTPFFWYCLENSEPPGQISARPHSQFPLWNQHYRLQWNLDTKKLLPPAVDEMTGMVRQAAAGLMVSVRLFGMSSWAGTNSYRLFFLYSRILSLHLFVEKGVFSDPQNIDALRESYQAHFPEARSWFRDIERELLNCPASEVDALDGSKLFYRHLPFLRRVLDKILPGLSSPNRTG